MAELTDIRETVRKPYADAASAYNAAQELEAEAGCCGTDGLSCSSADETGVFGGTLYDDAMREEVLEAALNASLGCGVPTAVADLREGETVLDLGSGAGADVLISARRVAPTGKAIGLDMTDEMLALARANAAQAGIENVEFIKMWGIDVVLIGRLNHLEGDRCRNTVVPARRSGGARDRGARAEGDLAAVQVPIEYGQARVGVVRDRDRDSRLLGSCRSKQPWSRLSWCLELGCLEPGRSCSGANGQELIPLALVKSTRSPFAGCSFAASQCARSGS